MKTGVVVGFALVGALAAGPALAHHPAATLGSVRITQPVTSGGTVLQPGVYEVRLTGEHVTPLPGQSEDAEQRVELIAGGQVVARDVATVIAAEPRAIGTSGGAGARSRVDLLKGGEFVRISISREGERFLIHLPPVAH